MRIIYLSILNLFLILLISCSTPKSICPENPALGNMGEEINTFGNELSPSLYESKLLYRTDGRNNSGVEEFIIIEFKNNVLKSSKKIKEFDFANFYNISSPVITINPVTGDKEMYFSASSSKNTKAKTDIFKSIFKNDKWLNPEKISINTEFFETNPTISHNGKFMIFSSDRPNGFGGMDLYKVDLNDNGQWSEPVNLGVNINTNHNELTPFIDNEGNLWFSTNAYYKNNLCIVKSNKGENGWLPPKYLPFPINTENYNETSPLIYDAKLIISSDRPNGCGNYDLYSFDICAPVQLQINITPSEMEFPINGNISIFENDSLEAYNKNIDDSSGIIYNLKPYNNYTIIYKNDCLPDNNYQYQIYAPCSDSNIIKLVLNIPIKGKEEFTFSKYNIPFFVSGYYLPNTTENLMALKMKFNYNLIGTNDSTKYIENPGQKYDKIAPIVDSALNEAVDFIIEKINLLASPCSKGYSKLEITVKGYADPRPISNSAKYIGNDIKDNRNNIFVKNGQNIDNLLLTQLRSYYTARTLEKLLKSRGISDEYIKKIDWVIKGLGVQQDKINYELLRRSDIEVKLLQ